jgi:DNA-binding beta-propeller fold protein YncE
MWSKNSGLKNPNWNAPQLAMSPDGRYVYFANVANTKYQPKSPADTDATFPNGRVYRQDTTKPGEDPKPFHDLELPDWEQTKYWLPDAWNKRTAAFGITTDRAGHVYVCDLVNQLIVELDADGKTVSKTKAPWPERIHVAPGGDYYVVSRLDKPKDGRTPKKLLRITGRGPDATIAAEMKLADRLGEASALTSIDGRPALWLAGGANLICVSPTADGKSFEPVQTQFKPKKESQLDWARLAVDAGRDEIYVNNGTSLTYRYDGKTGEGGLMKKDGKTFYCVDLAVGYDGSLYARVGDTFAGPLARFTRDLDPLPFPATGTHVLYDIYNRMGIGYSDKGLGAGPKGECYDMYMYDWNRYFVAGFDPDGKAIKGAYLRDKMKRPEPKSPNAKLPPERQVDSAVIGPVPAEGGGIAVDLAGNIYVGMRIVPKDFKAPAGFEKDPAYTTWTGSIVKFPPTGGTVLGAVKADDPADPQGPRIECKNGKTVVGAIAIYPGLSPFSGGGYGANGSVCVCRVSRFGLDRYARMVFANSVDCSATLIDNAGNPILSFGAYGNFDSQYVNPNLPQGQASKPTAAVPSMPLAWPTGAVMTDQHIYVLDTYNKRVLRADKTWALTASLELKYDCPRPPPPIRRARHAYPAPPRIPPPPPPHRLRPRRQSRAPRRPAQARHHRHAPHRPRPAQRRPQRHLPQHPPGRRLPLRQRRARPPNPPHRPRHRQTHADG